ncbi:MAG: class GN sortase [Nitrospirota bacterium]|nr:class GN sortase [Nitrospirota bacterium]MDH5587741.1 class GN sortase [Nitrospirota bacterium]
MALVTTTPRTSVAHFMVWIVASLLFAFGSWLIGQGAWIHIKAVAAQWLLQRAWQETLTTQQPVKPWPWADTWPVGRLLVPRLNINQIILANASGESLAFGPGKVGHGTFLDEDSPSLILSGHRDTHFSFVRDLQLGERLRVQTLQGNWQDFVVETREVVDSRIDTLTRKQEGSLLQLITCYPFESLLPGGPLRYVIIARPVGPQNISQVVTSASTGGGWRGRGMMVEGW